MTKGKKEPKYKFQRAAVACKQCRRSKTRCNYLKNGKTCFRCTNLGVRCSLADTELGESCFAENANIVTQNMSPEPDHETALAVAAQDPDLSRKIDEIHQGINFLLLRARSLEASVNNSSFEMALQRTSDNMNNQNPADFDPVSLADFPPPSEPGDSDDGFANSKISLDPLFFDVTPFRGVRAISSFFDLPFSRELAFNMNVSLTNQALSPEHDLINLGILDTDTARELVGLCVEFYGHWASFPTGKLPAQLFESIRRDSPLLLAVCCLLGLRHHPSHLAPLAGELNTRILRLVHNIMGLTIMSIPQSKQQLQGFVLLSIHSLSLSHHEVYLDGWYMSGYSLIHFITREMNLNLLSDRFKSHPDRVNNFRLWNHLALTHVSYCILSGRPCLIDTLRLDQCREILEIPSATSFDGKVVAELSILLTLYNALQLEETLSVSLKDLDSTLEDWRHLCEQSPLGAFIMVNYRFSRMMLYRRDLLKRFNNNKDFLSQQSPLSTDWAGPGREDALQNSGNLGVKQLLNALIDECVEIIELVHSGSRTEFVKCSDMVKFQLFFSTLVVINMLRQGFDGKEWISTAKLNRINAAIENSKSLCEWLDLNHRYFNDFVKGYRLLITRFSDAIREQEL